MFEIKKRICDHKAKYNNREDAKKHAKQVKKQKGITLYPYKCNEPFCVAWHLTSYDKEKGRKKQAAIRKYGDKRKDENL